MSRNLRVVATMIRLRLARSAAEPASFWSALLVDTSVFGVQALVFALVYGAVDSVNGWERWQAIFFVGSFMLVDGAWMCLYFFGVLGIPEAIRTGRLELFLAKPADPLLCLSFERTDPGSAFILLPALALVVGSARAGGLEPGLGGILAYAMALVLMLILMHSLMVLARSAAFWLGRLGALQEAENALVEFGFRLPGKALRGPWRLLFRGLLPYGLVGSFPAEVFFAEAGAGAWALALALTLGFAALSRLVWEAGLRRYTGTGS